MAVLSKPLSSTGKTISSARQFSLPIVAGGIIVAVLYFGQAFFITLISAIVLAFILEPFVVVLMRLRFPRGLASFVVCTMALLFLYVIGMGAYAQLSSLYDELPVYGQRIGDLIDNVQQRMQNAEQRTYNLLVPARQRQQQEAEQRLRAQQQQQQAEQTRSRRRAQQKQQQDQQQAIPPAAPGAIPEVRIHEERTPVGDYILSRLGSFYQILLMASFVPFLVYFMLSWRDHINRSFLQFFHGEDRVVAARSLAGIADMVRAFVVGNFLLGLLLAFLSSVLFSLIHLPFPLLVGPLSGVLSLMPYIGLPLALIPPLFAALGVNQFPVYVLVVVSVSLLHLLAMNLLYPKIVGSRVHLNPLIVTFSLMLWGFLWGASGLLLAIPMTAGLKAVCDNVRGMRPFGKFLGD
ncbi:MAG TPA: AI-2E family transporter [Bryobacteraceae bacterium]|nr:AI-2E family transporter [Bryobacteraceae bacterium]